MKNYLFIVLLLIIPVTLCAQLKLGLKGGVNLSHFKGKEIYTSDYIISTPDKSKLGYHVGLFARASFFGLFAQPELLYTVLRGETELRDFWKMKPDQIAQQQVGRVDIPVIAGARLGPARLGAGPVASIIVLNRSELENITGYKEKLKSATLGFQAGAGFDISNFSLDIRYEGSLSKLGDNINIDGQDSNFDKRASQIIFSLGLLF